MNNHVLFGSFHIIAAAISVLAALVAARIAADFVLQNSKENAFHNSASADAPLIHILQITGLVLLALELFKQIYLYISAGTSDYDWWYFPFQICSVPMYLCILLSADFISDLQSSFLTFLGGYTFVGAVAALIYPEDILSAAPVMSLHGFVWHAILLFISVLIFITSSADASAAGLARAALLFAILSLIAIAINVATEPVMQAGNAAHSYAAMFYMNPYHLTPQPIVNDIQKTAGIPAGLLLYFITIVLAGSLTNIVADKIHKAERLK